MNNLSSDWTFPPRQTSFCLILLACAYPTSEAAGAVHTSWPIGLQREVDEGVYMSVVASQNGWRIWRIETKNGISCQAVKSAKGRPHPIPVGVGSALFGGTPYLNVYRGYEEKLTYSWNAEHYEKVTVKIRRPGAKFWDEYLSSRMDMSKYGEEAISLGVSSWEYPSIYLGHVEEKAIFELKGVGRAIDEVDTCNNKDV